MITTAMDVARVIGLRRCTPGFLHRAAVGYLADEHRVSATDDWCDTAIDTAATELRGAVRALTPVPHTQGTQVASYRLADYLDQHGRKIFAENDPSSGVLGGGDAKRSQRPRQVSAQQPRIAAC